MNDREEILKILQTVISPEAALSLVQEGAVLFPDQAKRLVQRWRRSKINDLAEGGGRGRTISDCFTASPAEKELLRSEARRAGKRILCHRYQVPGTDIWRAGEFITSGEIVDKFLREPEYWEVKYVPF